jgi:hypothetical protein
VFARHGLVRLAVNAAGFNQGGLYDASKPFCVAALFAAVPGRQVFAAVAKAQKLTAMLEAELPKRQLLIDLDNLIATLETVEARGEIAKNLSNEPPRILFVNDPAILISIDGEPQIREEEGIERVI